MNVETKPVCKIAQDASESISYSTGARYTVLYFVV